MQRFVRLAAAYVLLSVSVLACDKPSSTSAAPPAPPQIEYAQLQHVEILVSTGWQVMSGGKAYYDKNIFSFFGQPAPARPINESDLLSAAGASGWEAYDHKTESDGAGKTVNTTLLKRRR